MFHLWMMIALLAVVTTGAGVRLAAIGQAERRNQEQRVTYRSSVQVHDSQNEREEANESEEAEGNETAEANEAKESRDGEQADEAQDRAELAESEQLKSLARVTPELAQSVALSQVNGTVKKVELENEDGNVVYSVRVKTANGESDVKVDAGDGRVLHIEQDGEDD
jgi:uncharacterized membrane protein YkoI